jgi:hypothetical protein
MCIESAVELAKCAEDKGLKGLPAPKMDERDVFPARAWPWASRPLSQKVARVKMTKGSSSASAMINPGPAEVDVMMKGLIPECKI